MSKSKAKKAYYMACKKLGDNGAELLLYATKKYALKCESDPSLYIPPHKWLDEERWREELS